MKKTLYSYIVISFFVLAMLVSCSSETGKVVSRNKMFDLVFDMYLAESVLEEEGFIFKPEVQMSVVEEVLNKHSLTMKDWDASVEWYARKLDFYLQINDSVCTRLRNYREELDKRVDSIASYREQVRDMLYSDEFIPRNYTFNAPSNSMRFSFIYDSVGIAQLANDSLSFKFSVYGMQGVYPFALKRGFTLSYYDTTIVVADTLRSSGDYTYCFNRIIGDEIAGLDSLKSFSGYVMLLDSIRCVKGPYLFDISLDSRKVDADVVSDDFEMLMPAMDNN